VAPAEERRALLVAWLAPPAVGARRRGAVLRFLQKALAVFWVVLIAGFPTAIMITERRWFEAALFLFAGGIAFVAVMTEKPGTRGGRNGRGS
jgi:hypothetical protein